MRSARREVLSASWVKIRPDAPHGGSAGRRDSRMTDVMDAGMTPPPHRGGTGAFVPHKGRGQLHCLPRTARTGILALPGAGRTLGAASWG
ncbi:hypothetical protein GCM10010289_32500 [Streptomyces violascens]|uniref:Uncharacterized protein n=1 Tax=Streptomyces violascens TaxID=67381 RepID=A0ABQ3R0U7_9ACTN|nr:hypothetical protein GCM10010289_32500 [Streptomyces violascens]GHI43148.1 hypothetical protein Sviol_75560 [Streptomyces violascens]